MTSLPSVLMQRDDRPRLQKCATNHPVWLEALAPPSGIPAECYQMVVAIGVLGSRCRLAHRSGFVTIGLVGFCCHGGQQTSGDPGEGVADSVLTGGAIAAQPHGIPPPSGARCRDR